MHPLLARLRAKSLPLPYRPLTFKAILLWIAIAAGSFQLAYFLPRCAAAMVLFLASLLMLSHVRTSRNAMNIGWVLGLLLYGPQLAFFWRIFGPGAISLWLVLAFWLGLFLVMLRQTHIYFGKTAALLLAPILWLGLEYFRGELYYLRFTWVNVGYAFTNAPLLLSILGMYGLSFVLMAVVASAYILPARKRAVVLAVLTLLVGLPSNMPRARSGLAVKPAGADKTVRVAGVQLEFLSEAQVLVSLERLRKKNPDTDLFMLSEYTFDGPVPDKVRAWCRKHGKYLVAGGKTFLDSSNTKFRNTAFVVGTNGDIVFTQVKAVPIQFFKDGLPATEQRVWDSPWGKLGFGTCYDLSYTRVVDKLARLGAQGILNPTMDVEDWGEHQHRLHSRVPITRAAEYGIPVFRVASSGISQFVSSTAETIATAPFAKEEAPIVGTMTLAEKPRVPADRLPALIAAITSMLVAALFALATAFRWLTQRPTHAPGVQ